MKKGEKNIRSASSVAIDITYCIGHVFWGVQKTLRRSTLLLLFCENRLCLSQLIKKLNSTEREALFRHFCASKVITTADAHKSGVICHFFPRAFKQKKVKALRPKMTKIASRVGSWLNTKNYSLPSRRNIVIDQVSQGN